MLPTEHVGQLEAETVPRSHKHGVRQDTPIGIYPPLNAGILEETRKVRQAIVYGFARDDAAALGGFSLNGLYKGGDVGPNRARWRTR